MTVNAKRKTLTDEGRKATGMLWLLAFGVLVMIAGARSSFLSFLIGVVITGMAGWQLVRIYKASDKPLKDRIKAWRTDASELTDEEIATDEPADEIHEMLNEFTADFSNRFSQTIIALLVTAFTALLAAYVLSYPGGFVGMIAGLMASYCVATGYCEFQSLYASVGVAIVILVEFGVYFALIFKDYNHNERTIEYLYHISEQVAANSRLVVDVIELMAEDVIQAEDESDAEGI